jgi:hypothetical protein
MSVCLPAGLRTWGGDQLALVEQLRRGLRLTVVQPLADQPPRH